MEYVELKKLVDNNINKEDYEISFMERVDSFVIGIVSKHKIVDVNDILKFVNFCKYWHLRFDNITVDNNKFLMDFSIKKEKLKEINLLWKVKYTEGGIAEGKTMETINKHKSLGGLISYTNHDYSIYVAGGY
jgi:hypothetical protein